MSDPRPDPPTVDPVTGHTVRRYDQELAKLRGIVLEMGERVVEQTQAAIAALLEREETQAFRVLDREPQIDFLSLDADEEVFQLIARRQPAAVDLRIVLALSKVAGEVERAGDKAVRIAHQALELQGLRADSDPLPDDLQQAVRRLDEHVCCLFERGIQALTTFDVALALGIMEGESERDRYAAEVRALLNAPDREDLPTRQRFCLLHGAHALDRIGNHGSNIAEQVIYVALGQDVRYRNREILIETLRRQGY